MRGNLDVKKFLALCALFLTAFAGVGVGIVIDDNGSPRVVVIKPKPKIVTAAPTSPGPSGPEGELDSTKAEIEQLRDPVPDDIPKPVLKKAEDHNDALQEKLPDKPLPLTGAQGYTERTSYQTRGFGAYRSKVNEVCLHFTVSHNIPNSWADVYAIGGRGSYLDRVGLGASEVADFDAHFLHTISYDRNPYTQGWFNQYCDSIEIVAYGNETTKQWMDSKLIKSGALAAWVRDRLHARGLPSKLVDPQGCNAPLGVTDHLRLDCGNDHVDVGHQFPWTFFMRQVALGPTIRVTKRDNAQCAGVNQWRHRKHHTKKGTALKDKRLRDQHAKHHKCSGGKAKQA